MRFFNIALILLALSCALSVKAQEMTAESLIQRLEILRGEGSAKAKEALKRFEQYGFLEKSRDSELLNRQRQTDWRQTEKKIKRKLQKELSSDYLPKLEKKWGNCGAQGPQSCLQQTQNYMSLNLPDKELCYPYTKCGFYHCMEEKYQCEQVDNTYFTELAFPTCSAYQKHIQKERYSEEAIKWIYEVMVCLQKGLIDECEYRDNCQKENRKKTCDYITKYTLEFHPNCYLDSHVGVCQLPFKDRINIWRTVGPYLTGPERLQAMKVVLHCLGFDPF